MTTGTIPGLPPASLVKGPELLEIVQDGVSRRVTADALAAPGLDKKVTKVEGKGLSTEDFTTTEKQKLAKLDPQSYSLISWAYATAFRLVNAVRDANSAIVTANIVWPDGSSGIFTTTTASVEFPGAIDAWSATYLGPSGAKVVTQPLVTRDANGAVSAQPAITIQ